MCDVILDAMCDILCTPCRMLYTLLIYVQLLQSHKRMPETSLQLACMNKFGTAVTHTHSVSVASVTATCSHNK